MTPLLSPTSAVITGRRILQGVQSASGLERVGDFYFVVGDDSPNLLRLDMAWNVVGQTRMFETEILDGERIAKVSKPDLEAMCIVEWKGRRELLCFGSGSKSPARDVCYRIDVTDAAQPQNVRAVAMTTLYARMRADTEIVGAHNVNLEGAAATQDKLWLFQRGNISTINAVMEFELADFMQFLDGGAVLPLFTFDCYTLPKIQNRCAGFSAGCTLGNGLLFSASVEDTDNEIDDGATLGSYVGYIESGHLKWICPVSQNGETALVKIEGLVCLSDERETLRIAAVTDNDEGASELLMIEIV